MSISFWPDILLLFAKELNADPIKFALLKLMLDLPDAADTPMIWVAPSTSKSHRRVKRSCASWGVHKFRLLFLGGANKD